MPRRQTSLESAWGNARGRQRSQPRSPAALGWRFLGVRDDATGPALQRAEHGTEVAVQMAVEMLHTAIAVIARERGRAKATRVLRDGKAGDAGKVIAPH
jgi:hypothetical protein